MIALSNNGNNYVRIGLMTCDSSTPVLLCHGKGTDPIHSNPVAATHATSEVKTIIPSTTPCRT